MTNIRHTTTLTRARGQLWLTNDAKFHAPPMVYWGATIENIIITYDKTEHLLTALENEAFLLTGKFSEVELATIYNSIKSV